MACLFRNRNFLTLFVIFITLIFICGGYGLDLALAATSANFSTSQERAGTIEYSATSSNYEFKAEIGHPGISSSTSTNYIFDHGTFWFESTTGVLAMIRWAVPQMRVGAAETNDDAIFYLTVRSAADGDTVIDYTMPVLATTSIDGTYTSSTIDLLVPAGTYDIGIKTHQHITKLIQDVALLSGTTTVLNFTSTNNTPVKGVQVLTAGDISGAGTSTTNLGDDVINSVDLSIIIPQLDEVDATHRTYRSNLNQDPVVNSVDLSLMISNLDKTGEY